MVDNQQPPIDQVTGFQEGEFGPRQKTAFLKAFKQHGNQTKAAHALGFRYKLVQEALKVDKEFKEAFDETLLEMRHELEGELYKAGKTGRSKEGKLWLEIHYPQEFKTSNKPQSKKNQKDAEIDALFDKLG